MADTLDADYHGKDEQPKNISEPVEANSARMRAVLERSVAAAEATARHDLVLTLHAFDAATQQQHLSNVSDAELYKLRSLALRLQCFEAAAACVEAQRRRPFLDALEKRKAAARKAAEDWCQITDEDGRRFATSCFVAGYMACAQKGVQA